MEELHVYDIGFFDEDAAAGGIAVGGAAEAAKFGSLIRVEGGVLGAGSERIIAHL